MMPSHRRIVLAALFGAACRAAPRAELPAPLAPIGDTTCTISPGRAIAGDTVTVALTEPVDPAHAPLPRNDAERFVFAQLYETLIRVDCQGRLLPGLASSWEQGVGDRWTFTLRADARFWDGAPVTARDVLAAWRARDPALAQTVAVLGERTLGAKRPGAPFQPLADPALAVTKPAPGGGWPIGTGSRWVSNFGGTAPATLWALPVPRAGAAGGRGGGGGAALPAIRFATAAGDGARDALDEATDLLVTNDPAALDYAGTRPEYVDAPLEWSRTYVLLTPGRDSRGVTDIRLESLRQAVRVEARPAEASAGGDGRFWFADLRQCDLPSGRDTLAAPAVRRRVVYRQGDRDAADLAARLVGLDILGRGAVATGLPPAAFESALRAGQEAAYMLLVRRRVLDFCRAALELPPWSAGGTITPLLDIRSHAVMHRGLPRLTIDWDGTIRFAPR